MSYLIIQENWQTFKDQFKDLFSNENFFNKKRRYFDKLFDLKKIMKTLVKEISKTAVDPIKFDTKSWNKFCNKYKKLFIREALQLQLVKEKTLILLTHIIKMMKKNTVLIQTISIHGLLLML